MAVFGAAKPKAVPNFVATLPEIQAQARLGPPVDLGPEPMEAEAVRVLPLPPQHRLPKTGAEILFWTGFGLTLLAAGLAMMKTRRDWLRSLKRI